MLRTSENFNLALSAIPNDKWHVDHNAGLFDGQFASGFGSEDIMQQMPVEGTRFRVVDATWRAIVKGAVEDARALKALRQPGQLAALTEANVLLDQIQKGLNAYLESKRLNFPRFFFLSNDELLEILAETKDPTRVQPHLKKCFEGIDALTFEPSGHTSAMLSGEGESVPFLPDPLVPNSTLILPAPFPCCTGR